MAVADDRQAGCDGCGRTVPLEELTAVSMPDGERVACCSRCEPHAREAARKCSSLDQRRAPCDGCTETYLEAELEDIVLDDGTVLACCPSCAAEAPGGGGPSSSSAGTSSSGGGTAANDQSTDGKESDGEETLCMQCNEWVTAELFRVTTIDDRTERFCPACKERAEEDGIIKDVDIRKTKAREVLGVDDDATEAEVRTAFHQQVKRAHPDQESGSKSAFTLVTDAYERLTEDD